MGAHVQRPPVGRTGQVGVALRRWVDTSNGTFYTLTDTKRGKLSFYNVRGSVLKRSIRVKTGTGRASLLYRCFFS
jgi:hypothetical protein